jgi:hypothetical protein
VGNCTREVVDTTIQNAVRPESVPMFLHGAHIDRSTKLTFRNLERRETPSNDEVEVDSAVKSKSYKAPLGAGKPGTPHLAVHSARFGGGRWRSIWTIVRIVVSRTKIGDIASMNPTLLLRSCRANVSEAI